MSSSAKDTLTEEQIEEGQLDDAVAKNRNIIKTLLACLRKQIYYNFVRPRSPLVLSNHSHLGWEMCYFVLYQWVLPSFHNTVTHVVAQTGWVNAWGELEPYTAYIEYITNPGILNRKKLWKAALAYADYVTDWDNVAHTQARVQSSKVHACAFLCCIWWVFVVYRMRLSC